MPAAESAVELEEELVVGSVVVPVAERVAEFVVELVAAFVAEPAAAFAVELVAESVVVQEEELQDPGHYYR